VAVSETKPQDQAEPQADLKSLPLPELEAKLATSASGLLVWFLINDRVKLLGYRILDPGGEPVLAPQKPVALAAR